MLVTSVRIRAFSAADSADFISAFENAELNAEPDRWAKTWPPECTSLRPSPDSAPEAGSASGPGTAGTETARPAG